MAASINSGHRSSAQAMRRVSSALAEARRTLGYGKISSSSEFIAIINPLAKIPGP